jgi:hypothetical protein
MQMDGIVDDISVFETIGFVVVPYISLTAWR